MNMIGKRIKQVRQFHKITQTDMAAHLSITKQTLSRYETGERLPDAMWIQQFLQIYNVDANWLLTGTGEMNRIAETNRICQHVYKDPEIFQLIEYTSRIPKIRRSILASFDQIKAIFEKDVAQYEASKSIAEMENFA